MILLRILLVFTINSCVIFSQEKTDTSKIIIDSTFISDSLEIIDSLSKSDSIVVLDTAITFPNYIYEHSFHIKRKDFLRNDYRYPGNLIETFHFNFIKDLGIIGQPNETFIYGVGFNGIGYLMDGVLYNDRRLNSLDLNKIQSEDIETIEIVPSPRGFLFSPWNNPVIVNFITRDFIPKEPYSRIKYYQGPDGEAMVDGSFNAVVSKRLLFAFNITNRKYDSSYTNTDFSTWMAKLKAQYYFTNNLYLTASYNYVDKKNGLWQGVNADSIIQLQVPLNDLLYEPDFAPVNSPFKRQKDLLHNSSLRLTSIQNEKSKTEITLYHRFNESITEDFYRHEYDNTTAGLNINQHLGLRLISFYADLNYEQNKLETWNTGSDIIINFPYTKSNLNLFSLSGIASLNLIENFTPSVFYKFNGISSKYDESNPAEYRSSGFGADLSYKPINQITLYAGYSIFDKSFYKDDKTNVYEAGVKYEADNYFADLRYFRRDNTNIFISSGTPTLLPEIYKVGNLSGIGLSGSLKYWYMQIETQTSAYFANEGILYNLPELTFIGGLYFRGNLFENNLDLKAGIKFTYTGEINSFTNEYGLIKVDPSNRIDFILSGEIRKAAIIYFTWENLADNQYFITPYYPMPGRSIRFGLAWELFN